MRSGGSFAPTARRVSPPWRGGAGGPCRPPCMSALCPQYRGQSCMSAVVGCAWSLVLDVAPVSCCATCPSRGMCGPFGRVPPHAVYLCRHASWLINLKPKHSTNKLFSLSHNFFRERRNANGFTVTVWCERGISVNERLSHHRVGPGQLHDAQTPAFSPRTGAQTI